MKTTALTFGLSTAMALSLAAPAFAQSSPEFDEIIVTATKRSENIQDVPLSVTALPKDTLDTFGGAGDDIQYLSARVPSLIIESSFGRIFPRSYIRGLGNTDFDLNASQPVSFIYDDVVFENPVLKGFPVFDTEQVEVLRGPQGSLFGRNTPAGIIKFDSVKPSQEADAYLSASYARLGTLQLEGAMGGAVTDDISFRLSGLYQRRDDYIENQFLGDAGNAGGYKEFAWRAQGLYQPTEDFSWLVNVHARNLNGGQTSFQANAFTTGEQGLRDGFDREISFSDSAAQSVLDLNTLGVTSKAELDFGNVTATYILGVETVDVFSRGDVDGGFGAAFLGAGNFGPGFIPFPAESADGINDHRQITNEVRLSNSNPGPLNYTVGLYSFEEHLDIVSLNYDTLAGGAENGRAFQTQDTSAIAVFGNVSYDVTDQLTLAGGLRYSDDDKDFTANREVAPFVGVAGALGPINISVGDGQLSWDASATYAVNDDVNVYARAARGFRSPSIQGRILFGDAVTTAESETLDSYEVGVKSFLLDRRLKANVTGYFYDIKDQQLTAIGGAGNFNQLLNADKGRGYGFEADVSALITDALTFTAGLSYNSTEIRDADLTSGVCGAACTVLDPIDPVSGGAFINGNSFPNAPEWIGNFIVDYRQPLGEGEFFASTDWNYRSDANIFLYESVEFNSDGWWEGGARIGYTQGAWTGAAFVRNITDEVGAVSAIDFNNLSGIVNPPRVYGVQLKWQMQ